MGQLLVAMSNHVLPSIAPKLAESLGVNPALIGVQVSLTFGVAAIAAVTGGPVVLKWGAARTTQICVLICVVGTLLYAVPSLYAVALGSVFCGIGLGLINPAAAHMLVKYTPPERRNLIFSIKQTGVPAGGVIAALMAPALAVSVGWQWAMAVIAAAGVLTLLAIQPYRETWDADRGQGDQKQPGVWATVTLVWCAHDLRWLSIVGSLLSAIQRCLFSFTVIYLVVEHRFGLLEAGVMLSAIQFGGFASRIFWGWTADRIGSGFAVMMLICLISVVTTVALTLFDATWPRPVALIFFFVLGSAAAGWNGVFHGEAARLSPPGMAGAIAGGTSFFMFGGVLFGPSLFALAYGGIGSYALTFWSLTAVSLLSLGLLLFARRTRAA